MSSKKSKWAVVKQGILGQLSGKLDGLIVQKNNIVRIKPYKKSKK